MADEILEPTPGSPNGGDDGGEDPQDGAPADGAEDGEPTRLERAEGIISDLKKAAGVNSVKELKEKLAPKPAAPVKPAAPAKPEQAVSVTHEEVALLVRGYTPAELDIAKRLRPDLSVTEAVEDEVAKHAINGMRQGRKSEEAIPEPSNRMPTSGGKAFQQLSKDEKRAKYADTIQKGVDKARQAGNRSPGR